MDDLYGAAVEILLKSLEGLNLRPRPIPSGRMNALRGGISCLELAGRNVEAAVLLARPRVRGPYERDAGALFKVDYALRGNIKGILPDRIVSRTTVRLRGLLRKRIEGLSWETPSRRKESSRLGIGYRGACPPGPGELWEGGPHESLTGLLNQDIELRASLEDFSDRGRGRFLLLHIVSDRWGESMRVGGSLWIPPEELQTTYASSAYLDVAERILGHVKRVREDFGGLAY